MKRIILTITLAVILCLSAPITALAGELGQLSNVRDKVVPSGDHGMITTEVKGVTDDKGRLAFSKYQNAEIKSIQSSKGTLTGNFTEQTSGSLVYYVLQFEGAEEEVEFAITWEQKDTYVLGEGKISSTGVSGLKLLEYSMVNSAPVAIENYVADVAVPQDWELVEILGFEAQEGYEIYNEGDYTFGNHTFSEIAAGGTAPLQITTRAEFTIFPFIMWAIVAFLSIFYLICDRKLLGLSKEVRQRMKREKEEEKALRKEKKLSQSKN